MGVSKEERRRKRNHRVTAGVILAWLSWVSTTLVQLKSDMTVVKFAVFGTVATAPAAVSSNGQPSLGAIGFPVPDLLPQVKK